PCGAAHRCGDGPGRCPLLRGAAAPAPERAMSGRAVQCHQVTVHRGPVTVLRAVELEAAAGEHVALVGPNGAGKSTLLHAVTGLLPAQGRVRVAGLDPRTARRRAVARVVALVPQRPVVPPGAL